jgi:hypothetical protein
MLDREGIRKFARQYLAGGRTCSPQELADKADVLVSMVVGALHTAPTEFDRVPGGGCWHWRLTPTVVADTPLRRRGRDLARPPLEQLPPEPEPAVAQARAADVRRAATAAPKRSKGDRSPLVRALTALREATAEQLVAYLGTTANAVRTALSNYRHRIAVRKDGEARWYSLRDGTAEATAAAMQARAEAAPALPAPERELAAGDEGEDYDEIEIVGAKPVDVTPVFGALRELGASSVARLAHHLKLPDHAVRAQLTALGSSVTRGRIGPYTLYSLPPDQQAEAG